MKISKYIKDFSLRTARGFFLMFGILMAGIVFVYAASLSTVTSGQPLTAETFNNVINSINTISTDLTTLAGKIVWQKNGSNINFTGDNVGIGVPTPTNKLEVAGNIKTTGTLQANRIESANGSFIKIGLHNCSAGPCVGNHTLQVRQSGGSWTWDLVGTTNSSLFTKNNGIITLNQAGTYMVRIYYMVAPTAVGPYSGAGCYCPFINGSVNCLGQAGRIHRYTQSGNWDYDHIDFTSQFPAGTTVARGYYPFSAMNYRAYDGYTSLEITKIN